MNTKKPTATTNQPTTILASNNFYDQLQELPTVPFKTKVLRGSMSLEQTKRNKVRRELLHGLGNFLNQYLYKVAGVYEVEEGIAIEVAHPDAEKCGVGEGYITFIVGLSVQSLEYSAFENSELFREETGTPDLEVPQP